MQTIKKPLYKVLNGKLFTENELNTILTDIEAASNMRSLTVTSENTPGCRSSLNQHVLTSGVEIEDNIILKQNNLNLHLRDLIKIQEYEENEFLKLIEEEQGKTRKPIHIVDVRKNSI